MKKDWLGFGITIAVIASSSMIPKSAHAMSLEQYASSVIDFSSEYSASNWSASQALGVPNTFAYGDIPTAWAPRPANGTQEFLTLGFSTPVYANGATIRETYGNGFVRKIDVFDINDTLHNVWNGIDSSQPGSPVDFFASWSTTSFLVKGLKIYIDTDHNLGTWEEIDAVKLHGTTIPPTAVPTPMLFPGLIGLGVAVLRKRGKNENKSAEA
ncbi:MAG: hypothetical protein B0A82_05360 [Alkalinema sp. CACIAM 70d]|nr:MAG: hypothetical protein B0A82_05360 [Alkalinema sp. CACIAM 70d]